MRHRFSKISSEAWRLELRNTLDKLKIPRWHVLCLAWAMPPQSPLPDAFRRYGELLRYVGYETVGTERVARFRRQLRSHYARITHQFYEQILMHDGARVHLSSEAQVLRLRSSLIAWLDSLWVDEASPERTEHTAEIGRVHMRLGIPARYVIAAMANIRRELVQIALKDESEDRERLLRYVNHTLDVELALLFDAYEDALVRRSTNAETWLEHNPSDECARYAHAVEHGMMLVLVTDDTGLIRTANREVERVLGVDRQQLFGRTVDEVLGVQDRLGRTWQDGESREMHVHTPSGRTKRILLRCSKADVRMGIVGLGMSFVGRDLTDEATEIEKQKRTEKLASVGTLATGLAHEIRNPLNGARLNALFVKRALGHQDKDGQVGAALDSVISEVDRLGALVTEFLDFARPKPLEREELDLRAVLTLAKEAAAGVSDMVPELDLGPSPVMVHADRQRMIQVFQNLIRNAAEAAAEAEDPWVRVSLRTETERVQVRIEDNGAGLKDPSAPIFDPFYTTKPNGTGLGLALVHRMVLDHGGQVDVRSAAGHTVFTVSIPLVKAPAGAPSCTF